MFASVILIRSFLDVTPPRHGNASTFYAGKMRYICGQPSG